MNYKEFNKLVNEAVQSSDKVIKKDGVEYRVKVVNNGYKVIKASDGWEYTTSPAGRVEFATDATGKKLSMRASEEYQDLIDSILIDANLK